MRFLLPVLLSMFLINSASSKSCRIKDHKSVVFFVDINASFKEVQGARKAACKRGQKIVVIPKGIEKLGKIRESYLYASRRKKRCKKNCSKVNAILKRETARVDKAKKHISKDIGLEIKNELSKLKDSGKKISSFVMSGHNGGGSFSSDYVLGRRTIKKEKLAEIFNEFPEIANNIRSLSLLGCYTAVKKEVFDWKDILPNIKLLAGYDDKGPLSDRPSAYKYIKDFLNAENKILSKKNKKNVKKALEKNIQHLLSVNAAIYVNLGCHQGKETELYYKSIAPKNEKMTTLSLDDCHKTNAFGEKHHKSMMDFFNGKVDPPHKTSKGLLRDIYTYSRKNDYCYLVENDSNDETNKRRKSSLYAHPETLMMLLFFNDVKINFTRAYKSETELLHKQITDPNTYNLYRKRLGDHIEKNEKKVKKLKEFMNNIENRPDKILKDINNDIRLISDILEQDAKEMGMKLDDISTFSVSPADIIRYQKLQPIIESKSKLLNLKAIRDNIQSGEIKKEVENARLSISDLNDNIIKSQGKLESLSKIEKEMKDKYWKFSEKNMEKKSRGEILDNLHLLKMYSEAIPNPLSSSYSIVSNNILRDLEDIPFSWHEKMPTVEKLAAISSVQDYDKNNLLFSEDEIYNEEFDEDEFDLLD